MQGIKAILGIGLVRRGTGAEMAKGIVKWFNRKKGFGFISMEPTAAEVFVHLARPARGGGAVLAEGDRVEFDTEEMPRGLRATNVRKLDLTPAAE